MSHLCPFVRSFRAFSAAALCALGLALGPSPAAAQDSVPISFPRGQSGVTINGAVIGHDYIDYVLRANAGQRMNVDLTVTGTNGNGTIYFNILPAGMDYNGLFVGSNEGRSASVVLPESRDWAIRVYLMGNDKDARKTVGFALNVSITGGQQGGASGGGNQGAALLPEEDLFVVTLANPGDTLNIRDAPRPSGRLLGKLPNGATVSNAGGCTISDGQQWCNLRGEGGGVRGWVAARFLSLPGPGGAPSAPPAASGKVMTVKGVAAADVLNVRSGPGAGNRSVGALANGDRVLQRSCQSVGSARWCEIEMMTDMHERGWVNAAYLGEGAAVATQLPSAHRQERLTFAPGADGKEVTDRLGPGPSVSYRLNARNMQMLTVEIIGDQALRYRIFNPDSSALLDWVPAEQFYKGQLWQNGDHVIEVENRSGGPKDFTAIVGIQ